MKNKHRKRRITFSITAIVLCQIPFLLSPSITNLGLGFVASSFIIWTVLLITWTDLQNKRWITKYFEEEIK